MATLVEIDNVFKPTEARKTEFAGAKTVLEILAIRDGGNFKGFDFPTVVNVDGEFKLISEWGEPLQESSIVTLVQHPEGLEIGLIIGIVVGAILIAATLFLVFQDKPQSVDSEQADPVYTLKGQTNQMKLNGPIESGYGRFKHWPSIAAKPYNAYIGKDQYLFLLLCVGQGQYDIENLLVDNTPSTDFADFIYEVIPPHGQVTLFRNNVQTTTEVGSITLWGYDREEYSGWFTATVNDANTVVDRIELDITLPKGLGHANDKGGISVIGVSAEFEFREIDNLGNPISDWALLHIFERHLATFDPQRFTVAMDVPSGRYQVRGRNRWAQGNSHKNMNTIVWESMRGFQPNVNTFGDVTLIAIRAKASNNLNSNAQRKFNVVATRKLPVYDAITGEWSEPVATRNPVWAFCDIIKAKYGGNRTDAIMDLENLSAVAQQLEDEGRNFDWVFDSDLNCFEALRVVAAAVRGVPMFVGSQMTIILDRPRPYVTAVFNQHNIVAGSFQYNLKLRTDDETDGTEVEYLEPLTFKAETVPAYFKDISVGDNLEHVVLEGVTDRNWAYREGLRLEAKKRYQVEVVSFDTGVEGNLVTYGDRIRVAYDISGWALGGFVKSIQGNLLVLADPVKFEEGQTHQVYIRSKTGEPIGPLNVVKGSTDYHILVVGAPVDFSELSFNVDTDLPLFTFSNNEVTVKDFSVTSVRPNKTRETVHIEAVAYNDLVYANDEAIAPPMDNPNIEPPDPSLPVVTGLFVERVQTSEQGWFAARWNRALGAQYYVVEKSSDPTQYFDNPNEAWDLVGTTEATSFEVFLNSDHAYLRVSAVNVGQGPWAYWDSRIASDIRVAEVSSVTRERMTTTGDRRITTNI